MKRAKPLKKALENWIKLAISQSGPAAALKQKGLVHNTQGETVLWGVFFFLLSSLPWFSQESCCPKVDWLYWRPVCFLLRAERPVWQYWALTSDLPFDSGGWDGRLKSKNDRHTFLIYPVWDEGYDITSNRINKSKQSNNFKYIFHLFHIFYSRKKCFCPVCWNVLLPDTWFTFELWSLDFSLFVRLTGLIVIRL